MEVLSSGRLTVRCEGNADACKTAGVWGHVDQRDIGDRRGSVYLCRDYLDMVLEYLDRNPEEEENMVEQVASVIVHEVYHFLGADEVAAFAMTPFNGPGAQALACGDSYSGE